MMLAGNNKNGGRNVEKIDFKKSLKQLYQPKSGDFELVDVPLMPFLMVDGHGDPNVEKSYVEAVEALYSVAYGLKFMSKKTLDKDYAVPPLEGLWWAADMDAFTAGRKAEWDWTMMILQPDWIDADMVERAKAAASRKKSLPALAKLRLETFAEGPSLQILHIGSYQDEAPTLWKLHHEVMPDRKSTRLNSSHNSESRMPSSA
jgi:hypothetical protein